MSSRAVRAFLPTLRELERELGVPVPVRVKILRELEYDLEELRSRFEAEGLSAEQARARSLEALVPDGRTLRELARLNTPRYRRLIGRLTQARVRLIERSAVVIMTLVVLMAETRLLLRADLLGAPSPFLWPVLGLGAVSFAVMMWEAFTLWVRGDHRLTPQGSRLILGLAALTMATGVFGTLVDGYRNIETLAGAVTLAGSRSLADPLVLGWLEREAALLAVSLVLALVGGLAWFVLTQWLSVVSAARNEVLGLGLTETFKEEAG